MPRGGYFQSNFRNRGRWRPRRRQRYFQGGEYQNGPTYWNNAPFDGESAFDNGAPYEEVPEFGLDNGSFCTEEEGHCEDGAEVSVDQRSAKGGATECKRARIQSPEGGDQDIPCFVFEAMQKYKEQIFNKDKEIESLKTRLTEQEKEKEKMKKEFEQSLKAKDEELKNKGAEFNKVDLERTKQTANAKQAEFALKMKSEDHVKERNQLVAERNKAMESRDKCFEKNKLLAAQCAVRKKEMQDGNCLQKDAKRKVQEVERLLIVEQEKRDQLEKCVKRLHVEKRHADAKLQEIAEMLSDAERKILDAETSIASLQKENHELETKASNLEIALNSSKKINQNLEKQKEELQQDFDMIKQALKEEENEKQHLHAVSSQEIADLHAKMSHFESDLKKIDNRDSLLEDTEKSAQVFRMLAQMDFRAMSEKLIQHCDKSFVSD